MVKTAITKNFSDFNTKEYLKDAFSDNGLGHENLAALKSLIKEFAGVRKSDILLELGGGPTIYQVITASKIVKSIYFSDYLEENLKEVRKWLRDNPKAWNWDGFIQTVLKLEGYSNITKHTIETRKNLIRTKIKGLIRCDVRKINPLADQKYLHSFDIIALNFCIDSITDNFDEWCRYLDNSLNLLKQKGRLVYNSISDVKKGWRVSNKLFPGVNIQPEILKKELEIRGLHIKYLKRVKSRNCIGHNAHLYCMAIRK